MKYLIKNVILGVAVAATAFATVPAEAGKRHHRNEVLAAGIAGAAIGTIIGGALAQPHARRVYIDRAAPIYVQPRTNSPVIYYQPAPSRPRPALDYDPAPTYQVVDYYRRAPFYRQPVSIYRPAPSYRIVGYSHRKPIYRQPLHYGGMTPWTREWYSACKARYRSFAARSGTFLGYDGHRHFCRLR